MITFGSQSPYLAELNAPPLSRFFRVPAADLIVDGDPLIHVGFYWEDREGRPRSVNFRGPQETTWEDLRARARESGWPGHAGGRWNYFKDDLQAFLRRFRRT